MDFLFRVFIYSLLAFAIGLILISFKIKQIQSKFRSLNLRQPQKRVAILHPNANAGAGGEKVLWELVYALTTTKEYKNNKMEIAIYSGESVPPSVIYQTVKDRFAINLDTSKIKIITLKSAWLVNAASYKFGTILFQVLGTIIFTFQALGHYPPHVFIDTTGLAFAFPVVKLLIPKVIVSAYVHYPFISHEMLENVKKSVERYNNSGMISKSRILTRIKIIYYSIFLKLYGCVGHCVDFAFCNSTWTYNHMCKLWKNTHLNILYPPCSIDRFSNCDPSNKTNLMVSLAQFRIEKRQLMQLEVFKKVKESMSSLQFMMLGSVRGKEDEELVEKLKEEANKMGIAKDVSFRTNLQPNQLVEIFKQATFGIHTMEAEHFGISIVEMMAAGIVVLAHDSAGPQMDIIQHRSVDHIGYLCKDADSYIRTLSELMKVYDNKETRNQIYEIGKRAKKNVFERYSDQAFVEKFLGLWNSFVKNY